ncbi:hypothetical protein K1T71_010308 [Dendrolimus kikuchii]|uniref:Uncharacterized protein n=1 Tax=Dendrolimus kikuchii TaxID=765133 RepID=A0ACC1CSC6_9NEOP|nr:hypothetical protein K1T71_010308 [Dendrolimus kikuchii]
MISVNNVFNFYNKAYYLNTVFKYKTSSSLPSKNYILYNRYVLYKYNKIVHFTSKSKLNFVFDIEKEQLAFRKSLSAVLESLLKNSMYKELPEVEKWLQKLLQENLVGGKNRRGFSTVMAYGMTEKPEKVNEHSLYLARTLGWCVEMFQAYGIILDDIMDSSSTRRGNVCWYRRPDVGLSCAINDSILVYNNIFEILKTHFRNTPNYIDIFHLITKVMCLTAAGQHLDFITAKSPKVYSTFTINRYNAIVKYKTAYYTYNLPVNLGLLLTSNMEREMLEPVNDICIKLGTLFQMQDDYIDCYGDETVTGKLGTDIQEGKCTWLAVQALQRCTNNQRKVFEVCYGSPEPAHIERVKRIYHELKIPKMYRAEEQTLYEEILQQTRSISRDAISSLLTALLEITYRRQL